jgi:predicted TIM-barrel fold metal-dependent hydrolase
LAEDKPPEETPAPPGLINSPPNPALLDPKYLAIHRFALVSAVVILTVINFFVGEGWWSLWPAVGWGIIFFFHLCLVKATNVDEEWVNERTDDLRLKSYDLGHIDDIDERYNTGARIGATRRARRAQGPIEYRYPLIDAHHHFWDLERNYHPWLRDQPLVSGRHGDYAAIRDTYLPDHYRIDWSQMNVVRSVHVEAEWDRENELGETQWLHEINEAHGFPNAIVAHAQLDAPNVAELLAQHRAYSLVRGIRHKPTAAGSPEEVVTGAPGSMSDPVWRKGYALLQDYGLSFDLQTPYWHLGEAAELARAFPRTLIILNHTGLPAHRDEARLGAWREAMTTAAAVPNIVVKISGLGEPHLQPWTVPRHLDVVVDAVEIFGVERCMFGSNFPVDRLYAPYETIMRGFMEMTRVYSMAERRAMFHDNAAAYYRIDV